MIRNRISILFITIALFICLPETFASESLVAQDQRRGAEQTYLTYPEWFLVHSPAEYAVLVRTRPPNDFPFLSHIGQLWSSYKDVTEEQLRHKYPLNAGYHVMILVISSSTTVEYLIRSAYENTIGRVSYVLGGQTLTAEDKYAAEVAQDYVDFIRQQPWYLYSFGAKLKGLWTNVPVEGSGFLRKVERRYALTTEYLIKAAYGWLIEKATRATYEPALMTTQVVLDKAPPVGTNIKVVKTMADGRVVADLPRYYDFRIAVTGLAQQGVNIIDIAGNTSGILVTVWAPDQNSPQLNSARILFRQSLITQPGYSRLAVIVPVAELSKFLLLAQQQNLKVEHVYDY